MPTKIIHGDITTAPPGTLICHQVNCQGAMGAGVALAIARKWPSVDLRYRRFIDDETDNGKRDSDFLGLIQCVDTRDGRTVANMFAQNTYGRGKRQTNYEAFYMCLEQIKGEYTPLKPIAFPYLIGCGLGGGNWNIIRTMIEEVLGDFNVTFYKFG